MCTARFLLAFLPALAGCATSDVGQVREVEPGLYKIGVARVSETVFARHNSTNDAIDQAGQYCHAKGQKLVVVPDPGRDVTFRCGEKVQEPPMPPRPN